MERTSSDLERQVAVLQSEVHRMKLAMLSGFRGMQEGQGQEEEEEDDEGHVGVGEVEVGQDDAGVVAAGKE